MPSPTEDVDAVKVTVPGMPLVSFPDWGPRLIV